MYKLKIKLKKKDVEESFYKQLTYKIVLVYKRYFILFYFIFLQIFYEKNCKNNLTNVMQLS